MGNEKNSSDKRSRRLRSQKIKTNDSIGTLSGEKARHIPQEIVAQILVRLPAKSLLKFKRVAKSWLALISSPDFIKDHLTYSTLHDPTLSNYRFMLGVSYSISSNNPKLGSVSFGLRDLLTDAVDVHRPNGKTSRQFEINGSCNGLLCITVRYRRKNHNFLWNPCLRMSKKLPPMPEAELPKNCGFAYGIGYDERNDDYKVVGLLRHVFYAGMLRRHIVMIYSLKNDSWKTIEDFKGGQPLSGHSLIYANGKIHFLASLNDGKWKLTVVSLDLENEVYGTVEHPEVEQPMYGDHCSLGCFKGCIGALYTNAGVYAHVWILKEYGVRESWTKVVRIPFVDRSLASYLHLDNLCILSNGKVLLGRGSLVFVYNPEDKSFIYPRIGDLDPATLTGIYAESLVPLPEIKL